MTCPDARTMNLACQARAVLVPRPLTTLVETHRESPVTLITPTRASSAGKSGLPVSPEQVPPLPVCWSAITGVRHR